MPALLKRFKGRVLKPDHFGRLADFAKRTALTLCGLVVACWITEPAESSAQIDSSWTNAAGGSWTDASSWSSTTAPNNGQPNAADTYNATIDLITGSSYDVNIGGGSSIASNSVTLNSDDARVIQFGSLNIDDRLDINAGAYFLGRNGRISGGSINVNGGTLTTVSRVTLSDTQINGTISVQPSGSTRGELLVGENVAFNGTVDVIRNSGTNGATLTYEGTTSGPARIATLGGDTLVNLRAGNFDGTLTAERNVILTIAPSVTVQGGGSASGGIEAQGFFGGVDPTIINQGEIVSNRPGGGSLRIQASDNARFINQGSLRATAGNAITINAPAGNFVQETSGRIILEDGTLKTGADVLSVEGVLAGNGIIESGTLGGLEIAGTLDVGLEGSGQVIFGTSTSRGDLRLSDTALALFDIGGTNPGEPGMGGYDRVIVGDNLELGGELVVSLINDFGALIDNTDEFTLFDLTSDSASMTGAFTNVANGGLLTSADGAYTFQVHYGAGSLFDTNQVVLSNATSAIPEPTTGLVLILSVTAVWSRRCRKI